MMTHEGTWRPSTNTHVCTPTSNFRGGGTKANSAFEEGPSDPWRDAVGGGLFGGEDTAQLSPPLAYVFGLDVHGLLFCGHSFACNTTDGA